MSKKVGNHSKRRFMLAATILCSTLTVPAVAANAFSPQLQMLGSCSVECNDKVTLTCNGSSCSADQDSCSYEDENGTTHTKTCPIGEPEQQIVIASAPVGSTEGLPAVAIGRSEASQFYFVSSPGPTAICTADCSGGGSVTCTATGADTCSADDNVACMTYHDNGNCTSNSCSGGGPQSCMEDPEI